MTIEFGWWGWRGGGSVRIRHERGSPARRRPLGPHGFSESEGVGWAGVGCLCRFWALWLSGAGLPPWYGGQVGASGCRPGPPPVRSTGTPLTTNRAHTEAGRQAAPATDAAGSRPGLHHHRQHPQTRGAPSPKLGIREESVTQPHTEVGRSLATSTDLGGYFDRPRRLYRPNSVVRSTDLGGYFDRTRWLFRPNSVRVRVGTRSTGMTRPTEYLAI